MPTPHSQKTHGFSKQKRQNTKKDNEKNADHNGSNGNDTKHKHQEDVFLDYSLNGEEDESFTDVTVEVEPEDEDRKEVEDQLSVADTFDTLSVDLTSGKHATFNLRLSNHVYKDLIPDVIR